MHELVIRDAQVVDVLRCTAPRGRCRGQPRRRAPRGGACSSGHREIRAQGLLLTPGFVDIHTHFDGQATWDSAPPRPHAGIGSPPRCSATAASVSPRWPRARAHYLINLMQGVEDLPEAVLAEGIDSSTWESFPQYMQALAAKPHAIDIGTQLPRTPRCASTSWASGAPIRRAVPTPDELSQMRARLVEEALAAGALGVEHVAHAETSRGP
jgi:N-acyl-D-aspartate/D-glutamate deacylase